MKRYALYSRHATPVYTRLHRTVHSPVQQREVTWAHPTGKRVHSFGCRVVAEDSESKRKDTLLLVIFNVIVILNLILVIDCNQYSRSSAPCSIRDTDYPRRNKKWAGQLLYRTNEQSKIFIVILINHILINLFGSVSWILFSKQVAFLTFLVGMLRSETFREDPVLPEWSVRWVWWWWLWRGAERTDCCRGPGDAGIFLFKKINDAGIQIVLHILFCSLLYN